MSDALSLLSIPHDEAMKLMVQEAMIPGLSVNALQMGNVGFGAGTSAEVGVFLNAETYNDPSWPYRGQVQFQYHRMDFADFFQGIDLSFRREGTFPMANIVTLLCNIFQIVILPSDFINDSITVDTITQTVTLRASPVSPRWMGSVNIQIVDKYAPDKPVFVDNIGRTYVDYRNKLYVKE